MAEKKKLFLFFLKCWYVIDLYSFNFFLFKIKFLVSLMDIFVFRGGSMFGPPWARAPGGTSSCAYHKLRAWITPFLSPLIKPKTLISILHPPLHRRLSASRPHRRGAASDTHGCCVPALAVVACCGLWLLKVFLHKNPKNESFDFFRYFQSLS